MIIVKTSVVTLIWVVGVFNAEPYGHALALHSRFYVVT